MESSRIDRLRSRVTREDRWRARVRRESSFARAVIAHRWMSFVALFLLLLGGGACFVWLEPEKGHTLPQAMYFTWSLMFGQPPEAFPKPLLLQVLFFVVPILGVAIFLEAIVEIALMLRDREKGAHEWHRIMSRSMKDHVVLVGLGRLGWRTYSLLRKLGEDVVVIERDEKNAFLEDVRRDGMPLFIGDARREQWLVEANVAEAKSIVLASDDDLANLEIALDARRIRPSIHVVMRMFDPNMAEKVRDGFQIHTAMSASSLAAPAFATAAVAPAVLFSVIVGDELVVSRHWRVAAKDAFDGATVGEAIARHAIGIVELRKAHADPRYFPAPDVRIAAGDELVVQGTFDAIERLEPRSNPLAAVR